MDYFCLTHIREVKRIIFVMFNSHYGGKEDYFCLFNSH